MSDKEIKVSCKKTLSIFTTFVYYFFLNSIVSKEVNEDGKEDLKMDKVVTTLEGEEEVDPSLKVPGNYFSCHYYGNLVEVGRSNDVAKILMLTMLVSWFISQQPEPSRCATYNAIQKPCLTYSPCQIDSQISISAASRSWDLYANSSVHASHSQCTNYDNSYKNKREKVRILGFLIILSKLFSRLSWLLYCYDLGNPSGWKHDNNFFKVCFWSTNDQATEASSAQDKVLIKRGKWLIEM